MHVTCDYFNIFLYTPYGTYTHIYARERTCVTYTNTHHAYVITTFNITNKFAHSKTFQSSNNFSLISYTFGVYTLDFGETEYPEQQRH